MPPTEENNENNSNKNKSKRNKRKKIQTSVSSKLNQKDEGNEDDDAMIEFITTISIKRDMQKQQQQQPKQQQQQLEHMQQQKQQAIVGKQQQLQCNPKDEDENIAIDLEHQSVLIQLEKILSSISGRSDLVLLVIRLRSTTEQQCPISCIYLGESKKKSLSPSSSILGDITIRLNDSIVARIEPAERRRNTSDNNTQTFGSLLASLQTSILYLRHRQQIYLNLIELYRKLFQLSRPEFQELQTIKNFWRQLHLLERYITYTSRFKFSTSNPEIFERRKNHRTDKLKMVHEIGPQPGVVNSTSLEDVELSEASDRAQSIQSLHSAPDTPTPDGTPSYEELQQRLEEYNRHIAHMYEQKNQLMRMHQDAKQHLALLEEYQQECNKKNLSFGKRGQDGPAKVDGVNAENVEDDSKPPNYESVNDVKNDMDILANRVKHITQIVNSQNQLIKQFPEDENEDLRTDQANLEQKLRDLRKNGDDLRSMASELDDMNANALQKPVAVTAPALPVDEEKENNTMSPRVVPIRIQPNEIGTLKTNQQKESEIEAMKSQLRRLKDMMSTIDSIESKACSAARNVPICTNTAATAAAIDNNGHHHDHNDDDDDDDDHERTPTPVCGMSKSELERNLRILRGVSSDVRAQSVRMDAEQERIRALQDEISRCSQQAAAAAQLGEDALKRHSVTPTPIMRQQDKTDSKESPEIELQQPRPRQVSASASESKANDKMNNDLENVLLAKSQEYEEVCRRLQELPTTVTTTTAAAANSATSATKQQQQQQRTSCVERDNVQINQNGSERNIGNFDPMTSSTGGAVTTSNITTIPDDVSADASSMQSNGSTSHAFSMPPSMNAIGGGVSWAGGPHSWNYPNFRYNQPTTVLSSPTCPPFPPPPTFGPIPTFLTAPGPMGSMPPMPPPPPVSLSVLTGQSANGIFYNPSHSTPPSSLPPPPPLLAPTLLDQFINQQQFCSQALTHVGSTLWQQQREIEYLHKITQLLQDRLVRLGGEPILIPGPDIGFPFRSESVPPSFAAAAAAHAAAAAAAAAATMTSHSHAPPPQPTTDNLFSNRAQSEQPINNMSAAEQQHHFVQQQQQQQHHLHQQHHQIHQQHQQQRTNGTSASGSYTESRQHEASSLYSTLNNASAMRSQTHHEPATTAPPIFMHHHNNAIHQNNANLRRAAAAAAAAANASSNDSNNTLNNQVPPGNRANNYWDNFKSYSRQNLLAPQSSKSNEDNQHHQQQQQQHHHQHHRQQQQQQPSHQQYPPDVEFRNGEYNPENPRLHHDQPRRQYAPILHRKCLYQQQQPTTTTTTTEAGGDHHHHLFVNEPNTPQSSANRNMNKDIVRPAFNQPATAIGRIKNFQQHHHRQHHQQQHRPNPLPLGTVITNPLHANTIRSAAAATAAAAVRPQRTAQTQAPSQKPTFSSTMTAEERLQQQMHIPLEVFDPVGNEFDNDDDQLTAAEIYGCNYEYTSSPFRARRERERQRKLNIGGNQGQNNQQQHQRLGGGKQADKIALKNQYRTGLLTDHSMRMIESFLDHWDNDGNNVKGGNPDIVLKNRHNINRYLRQLHRLQSTLRFDPNLIFAPNSALSPQPPPIFRQKYHMHNAAVDYDDEDDDEEEEEEENDEPDDDDDDERDEEPLYEQSDDDDCRDLMNDKSRKNNDNNDDDDDEDEDENDNDNGNDNDNDADADVDIVNVNRLNNINNFNQCVFERNLLMNNQNARKPEKFIKKQAVTVAKQIRQTPHSSYCTFDVADAAFYFDDGKYENRTTFSDCTDQRQRSASKNRLAMGAGYGRSSTQWNVEWNDGRMAAQAIDLKKKKSFDAEDDAEDDEEEEERILKTKTTSIRHAVSDSNVTETRNNIALVDQRLNSVQNRIQLPPSSLLPLPLPLPLPLQPTVKILKNQKNNSGEVESSENRNDQKIDDQMKTTDYETENTFDEAAVNGEDIDTLGAYSLEAQAHFQKRAISKGKFKNKDEKDKDRTASDKQKKSQEEHNVKEPVEKLETTNMESKVQNNIINDENTLANALSRGESSTKHRHRSRKEAGGGRQRGYSFRLDRECRTLIRIIMACLSTDLKSIVDVDSALLLSISKITASISHSALLYKEFPFPTSEGYRLLLSSEKLFAKMQGDMLHGMPKRLSQFLPWYENYLETILSPETTTAIEKNDDDGNKHTKNNTITTTKLLKQQQKPNYQEIDNHVLKCTVDLTEIEKNQRLQQKATERVSPERRCIATEDEIEVEEVAAAAAAAAATTTDGAAANTNLQTPANGVEVHRRSSDETFHKTTPSSSTSTKCKKIYLQNKQKIAGGGGGVGSGGGKKNKKNRGKR